jgi:hypothetical protein
MSTKPLMFLCASLAALAAAPVLHGQATVAPDQSVGAGDAQPYDALGYGIAADGTMMLVGSRGSDSIALNGGAVYAFSRGSSGWVQFQKLVFTSALAGDEIGTAIALKGTVGAAGAPQRGAGGAVFALRFDGGAWFPVAELTDAGAGANAEFGSAVACTADTIAVGAPASAEGVGAFAGRVRLFNRVGTQWVADAIIRATYPDPGDRFGFDVAMDGEWLAISAPGDDDAAINAGAVWLYRRNAGQYGLVQKIVPPPPAGANGGAAFGQSVAISGGSLVVGATLLDAAGVDSGAAFLYDLNATDATLRATLLPPPGSAGAQFGFSVATDGTSVVVGAPGLNVAGQLRGGAFLYLGTQTLNGVLAPLTSSSMMLTGTRVAVTSSSVIASAPTAASGVVTSAGRLFLLDRTRDCNASGVPDAIEIANGSLVDGDGDGIPDSCQCVADITGDRLVNAADLSVLLGFWGSTNPPLPSVDINRDGSVGAPDLSALLSAWGSCP